MKLLLFICIIAFLCCPVEGCMRGGISPAATKSLIAICVIFSPVILVGGAVYFGPKVAKAAVGGVRKRTSNLIAKQRNRLVKKVGAANFDNYIQQLFEKVKADPTPDALLELGTALFLNNDLQGAYQYITEALNVTPGSLVWPKSGIALFVRGMINQYLYDFDDALKDYQLAQQVLPESGIPAGADEAPQLTKYDAINAEGYAKMLRTFYSIDPIKEDPLQLLTSALDNITSAIEGSPDKQGMWHHNRGYTRYFRSFLLPEEQQEAEWLRAISDFDEAISSTNFGTTAEARSMKAQALALLGKLSEAEQEQQTARDLDPKVFYVDLSNKSELRVAWPLPKEKFRGQANQHTFEEKKFHVLHYCDHCSELIKIERGYICNVCNYRVHARCFPKVKGKDCWALVKQDAINNSSEDTPPSNDHVHHLKIVRFHKPTWCKICSKLVVSPIGKQGLQCIDCGLKLHKGCIDKVGKHFVDSE